MPRAQKPSKPRHDPLHVELDNDAEQQKYGRISEPGKRKKARQSEPESENVLDPKESKRIFELAREQQEEMDEMPEDEEKADLSNARIQMQMLQEEDEDEEDDDEDQLSEVEEVFEIDSGDMETMDALMPANAGERKTLADLIFAKIDQAESGGNAAVIRKMQQDPDRPDPALGLDPKVVEVYSKLGMWLSGYKSGPLPKAFKVIPSLPGWARILALTHPENWSPHACRAATRVFISNMKPAQAQLFLQVVLLDSVREDIASNNKLNPQLYEALKLGLYKPAGFFKGFIFPLLDSGCTLRESAIIASILSKKGIPVLHASAAIIRIANMEYSGPNSLFIRVLIDKKHELPYKVVDALVFHFIRLSNTYKAKKAGDTEKLPVLWHQSLLAFVQRYSHDLTPDQKDALLDVIRATPHPQIGPEVRRELVNSVARGEAVPQPDADVAMA